MHHDWKLSEMCHCQVRLFGVHHNYRLLLSHTYNNVSRSNCCRVLHSTTGDHLDTILSFLPDKFMHAVIINHSSITYTCPNVTFDWPSWIFNKKSEITGSSGSVRRIHAENLPTTGIFRLQILIELCHNLHCYFFPSHIYACYIIALILNDVRKFTL